MKRGMEEKRTSAINISPVDKVIIIRCRPALLLSQLIDLDHA